MKESNTVNEGAATIGLDLGDKSHTFCILDSGGEIVKRGKFSSTARALKTFFSGRESSLVAMEVGTHSPWISRFLESEGHTVLVANARKLRMIYESDEKDDFRDAMMLAQIARFDPRLLCPIRHRGRRAQSHLAIVKSRNQLVTVRTGLINHARGMVKAIGERLPSCSPVCFHTKAKSNVPKDLEPALGPIFQTIEDLTLRIRGMEKQLERLCKEEYPETEKLRGIRGVGPITSLAFVLTIEEKERFAKSRSVPAYLGLTPKRDQSGQVDKQLRITKAGDRYLRSLLVSCAHYILGPFGHPCSLRDFGLRLCERGGKNAKKRAAVAVARKLAVVMHAIWVSDADYDPFHQPAGRKRLKEPSERKAA